MRIGLYRSIRELELSYHISPALKAYIFLPSTPHVFLYLYDITGGKSGMTDMVIFTSRPRRNHEMCLPLAVMYQVCIRGTTHCHVRTVCTQLDSVPRYSKRETSFRFLFPRGQPGEEVEGDTAGAG